VHTQNINHHHLAVGQLKDDTSIVLQHTQLLPTTVNEMMVKRVNSWVSILFTNIISVSCPVLGGNQRHMSTLPKLAKLITDIHLLNEEKQRMHEWSIDYGK